MSDHFALLNEPRRPWLDPEKLKETFLAASAAVHPDRVHTQTESERAAAQERYTRINAAYSCLRDPRERLRHLLELERGPAARDVQQIPSGLMDLSLEVGQTCRQADALIAEKARITSPLLQVRFFERSQELIDSLRALQQRIAGFNEQLIATLKELDDQWMNCRPSAADRAACLQRLEELHQLFGFFNRWSAQLQERFVQLSF